MAIALSSIWNGNPIFQRAASGNVSIVVNGTYSGPTADIIGQLIRPDGSLYTGPFALASSVSSGAFASIPLGFPAQSIWLKLQLWTSLDGTVYSSNWFGTGDVWLIGGQSIAELLIGQDGGIGVSTGPAAVYVPDAAEGAALFAGGGAGWQTGLGPAGCALANAVMAHTGVAVGFVFLARGGVPLCKASANPSTPLKYLLSQEGALANFPDEQFMTICLETIAAFGSADYKGLIFIGNEADTAATPPDQVYLGLNEWLSLLSGVDARPVIMSLIGSVSGADQPTMRATQTAWGTNTPGGIVGASRYGLATRDGTHPTQTAMQGVFAPAIAANVISVT